MWEVTAVMWEVTAVMWEVTTMMWERLSGKTPKERRAQVWNCSFALVRGTWFELNHRIVGQPPAPGCHVTLTSLPSVLPHQRLRQPESALRPRMMGSGLGFVLGQKNPKRMQLPGVCFLTNACGSPRAHFGQE
eukprot:scaffold448_cov68-Phaeocystis_antarctica.AAC.1